MSVALHGNLEDFGIAEVFQLIGQQRKTGTLVVGEGSDSISLAFDAGRVVRGGPSGVRADGEGVGQQLVRSGYITREQFDNLRRESERSARPLMDLYVSTGLIERETLEDVQLLLTRETVFDVIRRRAGNFHFTAEPVAHETRPEHLLGAEQILMDGLRMLDEWQTFADAVPSDDLVFRRIGSLESVRALTKGDGDARLANAERVMHLIDGRLSVRRIVDLSRIGTFEATRALAELRQAGVIDVVTTKKAKPARARRSLRSLPIVPILRACVGGVLPLAALVVMGTAIASRTGPIEPLPGTAIPARIAHHLGHRFETDLIRGLLETRYFETGRYPSSLEEIADEAVHASRSLTRSRLADYYYRVRDEEVVLLAPAR
jgi:hypothetical protein